MLIYNIRVSDGVIKHFYLPTARVTSHSKGRTAFKRCAFSAVPKVIVILNCRINRGTICTYLFYSLWYNEYLRLQFAYRLIVGVLSFAYQTTLQLLNLRCGRKSDRTTPTIKKEDDTAVMLCMMHRHKNTSKYKRGFNTKVCHPPAPQGERVL